MNNDITETAAGIRAVAMAEMYSGLDKYGCNTMASRFVVPVCAVMKGDGPAIFITAACVYVTEQAGVEIDAGKVIFIILLTFSASLAVPNIPSSSMVLVVTVLSSIGVPTKAASILFAMEWLLDRCRSGIGGLSVMYLSATTSAIYESIKKKSDDETEVEAEENGVEFDKSSLSATSLV
ncbi:unnamed protein product [Mesocestoides corti]|uniref:Amino acid transporter n=2 Tax=Mesocestoides corti TaxID=53468 RepID=A0A0R3UA98_MESCO|nr:unnamed protein product [Mesocestoides corti]